MQTASSVQGLSTESGKAKVLQTLMRGGKWSTPALAKESGIAHNTTIRCINEWRRELTGYRIEDERVPDKSYNRYWLEQTECESGELAELRELLDACDNALLYYPDTCGDRPNVQAQRDEVAERIEKLLMGKPE